METHYHSGSSEETGDRVEGLLEGSLVKGQCTWMWVGLGSSSAWELAIEERPLPFSSQAQRGQGRGQFQEPGPVTATGAEWTNRSCDPE